jgi:hypothetical protein
MTWSDDLVYHARNSVDAGHVFQVKTQHSVDSTGDLNLALSVVPVSAEPDLECFSLIFGLGSLSSDVDDLGLEVLPDNGYDSTSIGRSLSRDERVDTWT